jgi:hypothetical protein
MLTPETFQKGIIPNEHLRRLEERMGHLSGFDIVLLKPKELEELIEEIRWLRWHLLEMINVSSHKS